MRLKHLKISGFKSFADEMNLSFEEGITAIVGPNGCGKSNVSDGMRWVLGEQSSRSLRCAKMEDILFNGGAEQKPANVAEVAITITNEDNALPLDSPNVTITRQLHRSGESKYFINGAPSLLRDIHELFMDTGVGVNAYSLMEQSNIDLILNSRPQDRRFLFDEVAGITKYKYRKKAALKKLEETDQNLLRIHDIMLELEQQTEVLRTQAEKAADYRQRHSELKAVEIELGRRQWQDVQTKLAGIEEEFRAAEEGFRDATRAIETLEVSLQQGSLRRTQLDEEVQGAQSQVHKLETEIERTESTIALYKERQMSLSEQRQNAAAQIANLRSQLERIAKTITDRHREREQLEIALVTDESKLRGRERVLQELTRQIQEAEERINGAKSRIIELMNQNARAQNELTTLENRAEYSQSHRGRLQLQIETIRKNLDTTRLQVAEAKRRVTDLDAQRATLKAELTKLDHSLEAAQAELRKLEAEMRGHQDTLGMAMSRVKSLEDLHKSYEGYYLGVRAVLRMAEKEPQRLPGICGVVAELIRTHPDHEQAVEVALGAGVQNIVTESAEDAKLAIDFLKQNRAGRVTFLPLDILRPRKNEERNLLRYPGVVGLGTQLVESDPKYRVVVEYLLGNVLIVETLDAAINISRRERTSMRLVTLDGEIINPGGAMSGGHGKEQTQGFLQRPREIEDLKERITQLSEVLEKKEGRRKSLSQEIAELQKGRTETQSRIQAAEIERAGAEKDRQQISEKEERFTEELTVTENELTLLSEETGTVERDRDDMKGKVEDIQKELTSQNRLVERLQEQIGSEVAKRSEVETSVTAMKIELAGRREKMEGMTQAVAALEENRVEVGKAISDFERSVENSEQVAKELEEKISETQRSFLLLEHKKFEHAEEVVRLEAEREQLLASLAEGEKEIRRLRRELEKLSKVRHNLDVTVTQLHMQEQTIADRLMEKYRVTVKELAVNEEVGTDDFQVADRIRELQAQIEAMGAVNLMAIEEYEQHRQRFDFLKTQREDLEAAKESIQKAIHKINETSRARFLETFEQVRVNFQAVFAQIFGGGETDLALVDSDDVLEAGIEITARPPGKRPQNITMLSGGERALVAIALLFAVFKIRPSPFCVLDEVDAALDEANVLRFANILREFARTTQFVIITHNKRTMEKADLMYGVTMEKAGVSKVVSVRFGDGS